MNDVYGVLDCLRRAHHDTRPTMARDTEAVLVRTRPAQAHELVVGGRICTFTRVFFPCGLAKGRSE